MRSTILRWAVALATAAALPASLTAATVASPHGRGHDKIVGDSGADKLSAAGTATASTAGAAGTRAGRALGAGAG